MVFLSTNHINAVFLQKNLHSHWGESIKAETPSLSIYSLGLPPQCTPLLIIITPTFLLYSTPPRYIYTFLPLSPMLYSHPCCTRLPHPQCTSSPNCNPPCKVSHQLTPIPTLLFSSPVPNSPLPIILLTVFIPMYSTSRYNHLPLSYSIPLLLAIHFSSPLSPTLYFPPPLHSPPEYSPTPNVPPVPTVLPRMVGHLFAPIPTCDALHLSPFHQCPNLPCPAPCCIWNLCLGVGTIGGGHEW